MDDDLYYRRDTALQDRLKRSGLGSLLGEAAKTAGHNAKKGAAYASPVLKDAIQKFRNEPEIREKVKGFMRDKARGVMERTKVASQEFSRNARATASLLAGAFDPRGDARMTVHQTLSSRSSDRSGTTRSGRLVSPTGMPGFGSTARLRDNIRTGGMRAQTSNLLSAINQQSSAPRWGSTPGSAYERDRAQRSGSIKPIEEPAYWTTHWHGDGRGYDRSDPEFGDEFVSYFRNIKMPQLIATSSQFDRLLKRTGVTLEPLGQVRSSSSTDIGKRLLGL